ncbi:MAG: PAS domain-containing sensor histidine kinase, partial [Bdellovibrionales bacterium]
MSSTAFAKNSYIDSLPEPILVEGENGKIQAVSQGFLIAQSLERNEVLDKNARDFCLDQDWRETLTLHKNGDGSTSIIHSWQTVTDLFKNQRSQTARNKEIHELNLRQIQSDDELFLKELEIEKLRYDILGLQRHMLMTRAQFQSVGEALALGIWTCKPDGSFDYASNSFLKFLGIPHAKLTALYIFERAVNTNTPELMEKWRDCLRTGDEWDQELRLNGPNGEVRTVRSRARCMRNEVGEIIAWTGINLDMTDRKLAEIQLKDSHMLFRQLTETLSDQGVWMTAAQDSEIKYLSPGVSNIWGVTEDEIRKNPEVLLNSVFAEDREIVATSIKSQNAGEMTNLMYRVVRPDGELRWVSVRGFPVRNSEGRIYRVASIATDITEFKRVQTKLKRATRTALMASRVKTQFLANMSHEIRTPLGAILGFTELISRSSHSSEIRDWISIIQRNGNHLLGLIDEILDISQIEANCFEVVLRPTNPREEANEAVLLLTNRAQQKNLDLQINIEGKIPSNINCDPTRLRQILINLVGNAIKFTENGFVRLTLRTLKADGSSFIEFLVEDSGKGIPTSQHRRLFQPFVQGDSSTKRTFGGTGLGLAISQAYAQALGGTVELEKSV